MYGLIFENFSGYIKVSWMASSQQRPFTIFFKVILNARKMHIVFPIHSRGTRVYNVYDPWRLYHSLLTVLKSILKTMIVYLFLSPGEVWRGGLGECEEDGKY